MRKLSLLLSATAVVFLLPAARADVLKLSNGGQLKGTLEEVTFLIGGKNVATPRADIAALYLSETAQDWAKLKDGSKLEGELLSLKFRSIGGALTFARRDVKLLDFAADSSDKLKKELAAKAATIPNDDAKGLYELAKWCRSKGLKVEAAQLARKSLTADAAAPCAGKAHLLLGHVRYKGEWMTPTEMLKRKKADGGNKPAPDPAPKADPADIQAIKSALAKNEALYKTYCEKVEGLENEDLEQAKGKYKVKADELKKQYDKLKRTIDRKEDAREKARKTYKDQYGNTASYKPNFKDGLEEDRTALKKVTRSYKKLAKLAKSARSKVKKRSRSRKTRVTTAYDRNRRLLLTRKKLDEDAMTNAYEAALKSD